MDISYKNSPQFADAAKGRMMIRPYRMWWNRIVMSAQGGNAADAVDFEVATAMWRLRGHEIIGSAPVGSNPAELYQVIS